MGSEETIIEAARKNPIRVVIAGPDGRMGRAMTVGLADEPGIAITGGIRRGDTDLSTVLATADVLLDFTNPEAAPRLLLSAVEAGVRPVTGTSGLSEDLLATLDTEARKQGIGAVWAPNLSIGGILMSVMARLAARYIDAVEIIEGHPSRKADAPSGTALAMTRSMRQERGSDFNDPAVRMTLRESVRGAVEGGVRIHSVRHPSGSFAWHQVIFSSEDGLLTIRHDDDLSFNRSSAAARTIREVMRPDLVGLVRGYESVLGLTI